MKVRPGARSDTGRVRAHNEDAFLIKAPLYAIADGMGGHDSGEVASAISLSVLGDAEPDDSPPGDWLSAALKSANKAVFAAGAEAGAMLRMGTTLTAAYVTEDSVWIGHVGDSRAYLCRDGDVRQLTDDHSLVGEWLRDGRLTREEAAVHPQRSVITRALGIDEDVQIDVRRLTPARGDRIMLCSDGLTDELSDTEIREILANAENSDSAAGELVESANRHGGKDNITVVVLDILEDPASAPPDDDSTVVLDPVPSTGTHPDDLGSGDDRLQPSGVVVRGLPESVHEAEAEGVPGGRKFWIRFTLWATLTLVIVLGGWLGLNWYVNNSWYVGVLDGNVAVFQGIPEGVLGMTNGKVDRRTSIPVSLLPTTTREKVEAGIPADSRDDALEIVENLREQSATTTTTTTTTTTAPPPPPAVQGPP
jgi:serine/threonine protein phosphatase PrpC